MRFFPRVFYISTAVVVAGILLGNTAWAAPGDVSTWMSKLYAGDGLDANQAFLDNPGGFTADASCSLYVADTMNNVVRKIDGTTNKITTLAGNGQFNNTNGAATKAAFRRPADVVFGPSGELYVADKGNNSIRKIQSGVVSTWIKGLKQPTGLAVSGSTLYIAETGRNRILKVSIPDGAYSVVATVTSPIKISVLGTDLYVLGKGSTTLNRVSISDGIVVTIKSDFDDADGVAVYNSAVYVVAGLHGVINEIWRYTPIDGTMTKLQNVGETQWYNHASDILFCAGSQPMRLLFSAGSSVFQADADGGNPVKTAGKFRWNDQNGPRQSALLGRPSLLVQSPDKKHLYIYENNKLVDYNFKTNQLSFLAGHANDNYVDGTDSIARLSGVGQMVLSPKATTLYLADRNNNRIRVFNLKTKMMSTLTGAGGVNMFNGEHNAYAEGQACAATLTTGASGCAYFDRPMGLALSPDGKTLYVTDSDNNRIRTVNVKTGATALLAGSGKGGLKDGVGDKAQFRRPVSLLLSKDGKTLYVVEWGNHAVRQIDVRTKKVTTLIGNGKAGYRDGAFKKVRLSLPNFLSFGPKNILYLTEGGSLRVRVVNLRTKSVGTLTGSGKAGFQNGRGRLASFSNPRQSIMASAKTLLVADQDNDVIRAVKLK